MLSKPFAYDPLWGTLWLAALSIIVVLEIVALILRRPTLSQITWTFYDTWWKRAIGVVFFAVLLFHFFVPPFLPGWAVAVTAVPFAYVFVSGWVAHRKEDQVAQYSVKKGVEKGAQGVRDAWLGVALAAGVTALVAGVDVALPMLDETSELRQLGLPAALATAGVFIVRFLSNLWKAKRAGLLQKGQG